MSIFLASMDLQLRKSVLLTNVSIPTVSLYRIFAGFEGVLIDADYGKSKCYGFGLWE